MVSFFWTRSSRVSGSPPVSPAGVVASSGSPDSRRAIWPIIVSSPTLVTIIWPTPSTTCVPRIDAARLLGAVGRVVVAGRGLPDRLALAGHQRLVEYSSLALTMRPSAGISSPISSSDEVADRRPLRGRRCGLRRSASP